MLMLVVVLLLNAASPLVGLRSLEGGDECVGEGGEGLDEGGGGVGGEAVEGDIEAELEGSAVEGVGGGVVGVGGEAGSSEEVSGGGGGAEEGGGDMERGDLRVAPPPCEAEGVPQD